MYTCDTCGKRRPTFDALRDHYKIYPACLAERTRLIMESVNHKEENHDRQS